MTGQSFSALVMQWVIKIMGRVDVGPESSRKDWDRLGQEKETMLNYIQSF